MQTRNWTLMLMLAIALTASGCIATDDPPENNGEEPAGVEGSGGNETINETTGEVLSAEAAWTTGASGCLNAAIAIMVPALEDIDFGSVSIPSQAHGADFNATLTSAAPPVEWGIYFWAGEELAGDYYSMDDQFSGTVPDGSDTAQFFSCGGGELSAKIQAVA